MIILSVLNKISSTTKGSIMILRIDEHTCFLTCLTRQWFVGEHLI